MNIKLQDYMRDGASPQAKAVLAYLQENDGIEDSWDDEYKKYLAEITVNRWENGRERGYVVSMQSYYCPNLKQLNIAFFECRSSDNIHAVKWIQKNMNSIYAWEQVKWDENDPWPSHSVSYGKADVMARWIWKQLENHYKAYLKERRAEEAKKKVLKAK